MRRHVAALTALGECNDRVVRESRDGNTFFIDGKTFDMNRTDIRHILSHEDNGMMATIEVMP